MMMTQFPIPVDLLPPDYRSAVTLGVVQVEYATPAGDLRHYVVPTGLETDFASIPRFFWRVWPPWGPWTPAALAHDHMYATHSCERAEADYRFRAAMKVLGVGLITRWAFWAGVRLMGWRFYGGNR